MPNALKLFPPPLAVYQLPEATETQQRTPERDTSTLFAACESFGVPTVSLGGSTGFHPPRTLKEHRKGNQRQTSMPGSFLPSSSSSDAPPPVET